MWSVTASVYSYDTRPSEEASATPPEPHQSDLLEGFLIEVHPRQRLSMDRSVIGRIIDTTGSPWHYAIHQKKGLDWYQKPVAYLYSGYFKALHEGPHTFGVFVELGKVTRRSHSIHVSCAVSVCLAGDLKIEHRKQSYRSSRLAKKKHKMQLAYFVSELLAPSYHRLSIAVACDGNRRPEILEALRFSIKVKSPANTVMSDVTPALLVHKREPKASDAASACGMTER